MKKRISKQLAEIDGGMYNTVQSLREWINDEKFSDDDVLEIYAETYGEDDAEVIMRITNVREETDAEYAERFNREEEQRRQREAQTKASRYQSYLQMRDEFEPQPEDKVGEVA